MLRKKTVRCTVFADVATSVSEAIGALRRKIPITCSKQEVMPLGVISCLFIFIYNTLTFQCFFDIIQ